MRVVMGGLLTWAALTLVTPVHESETSEHASRLSVGLAGAVYQTREDLLRPLRWSGPGAGLRFGYERRGGRGTHVAELPITAAYLTDRFGNGAAAFDFGLSYGYLHELFRSPVAGGVRVGGLARAHVGSQYYSSWDDAHLYWLTAHDLSPWISWKLDLSPIQHLSASVAVPVVALVSRPSEDRVSKQDPLKSVGYHLSGPNHDLTPATLNRYVAVSARAAYDLSLGRRSSARVQYELDLRTYTEPRAVETLSHGLAVQWVHGF